jgi:exodeoxyribonuclease VII small subunit
MAKKKTAAFEQTIEQLEDLVLKMDSGELSLEESLKAFEQGIALIRQGQQNLQAAEQKVQELIENGQGESSTVDADFSNNE